MAAPRGLHYMVVLVVVWCGEREANGLTHRALAERGGDDQREAVMCRELTSSGRAQADSGMNRGCAFERATDDLGPSQLAVDASLDAHDDRSTSRSADLNPRATGAHEVAPLTIGKRLGVEERRGVRWRELVNGALEREACRGLCCSGGCGGGPAILTLTALGDGRAGIERAADARVVEVVALVTVLRAQLRAGEDEYVASVR